MAIGKYDNKEEHVAPGIADTLQVSAKNGKQLTPSSPAQHAESQEQVTHVTGNSTSPTPTNRTLRHVEKVGTRN